MQQTVFRANHIRGGTGMRARRLCPYRSAKSCKVPLMDHVTVVDSRRENREDVTRAYPDMHASLFVSYFNRPWNAAVPRQWVFCGQALSCRSPHLPRLYACACDS
jgi:hypothetical protein